MKKIIFGIQGGKGSFNEEALNKYLTDQKIKNLEIKYLFTSENVLKNLVENNIDFGIFAICNTIGGFVEESIEALKNSDLKFNIVQKIDLKIKHFLMKKKESNKIDTIIAHPQVLKQCKNNLAKKYGSLKLESGTGNMIDTAKSALALSLGQLPDNYAILGPSSLVKLYDFEIIDKNLQDSNKNQTTFLLVKRI